MTARPVAWNRSYLYAPASNHRILAKVFDRGADAIVLDLEDGVAAREKVGARIALGAFLDHAMDRAPGPRLLVRINRDGDGWSREDLAVAVHPATAAISLPKAEDPAAVVEVADAIADFEAEAVLAAGTIGMHLLVESAVGVQNLERLARVERVERFGLGAADLQTDLGIIGDLDPAALDHVRGRMVIASRAAGLAAPVDAVHTAIDDLEGLRVAASRARGFGFFGKSVVHPTQVAIVNRAFTPTADERAWASKVVAAAHAAAAAKAGAVNLDGTMIDAPILVRAQALLAMTETSTVDEVDLR